MEEEESVLGLAFLVLVLDREVEAEGAVRRSTSAVVLEGTSSLAEAEAGLAPSAGKDTLRTASAASSGQGKYVRGRSLDCSLTVVGLAGGFAVVAEEPAVAISVRDVLAVRAEKTRPRRQNLTSQQTRRQAWEVCMLAGVE